MSVDLLIFYLEVSSSKLLRRPEILGSAYWLGHLIVE